MGRAVAASVAQQVQQDDAVALLGQRTGDAPVQLGVEQQAVQVDHESIARAVHVVDQLVAVLGEGLGAVHGHSSGSRGDHHPPPRAAADRGPASAHAVGAGRPTHLAAGLVLRLVLGAVLDVGEQRHEPHRAEVLVLEPVAPPPHPHQLLREPVADRHDEPAAVRGALLVALRDGDWHCGVGVGEVDDDSFATGTRAGRGPAYLAARDAVEAAKSMTGSVAVRVPVDSGDEATTWAGDCEAVWTLVARLVLERTEAQWRAVDAVDRSPTQAAAADELGITPTSVAGALRLSHIREERAAYPALDRLLIGAHTAATGTGAETEGTATR